MNELDRIREQIKRMRCKGVEPETVYIRYELWERLGMQRSVSGVPYEINSKILGRFEVR